MGDKDQDLGVVEVVINNVQYYLAVLAVQGSRGLVGQDDPGLLTRARAMATRWRSPPDRYLTFFLIYRLRPTCSRDSSIYSGVCALARQ